MQKFISKYAAAAHLALLAVAPLLLYPFCTNDEIIIVELWLIAFCIFWIFFGPSRFSNETMVDARIRVLLGVVRDPFMWFALFIAILAIATTMNDGVAIVYDPEFKTWSLNPPKVDFLPATVAGANSHLAAVMLALLVIVQGIRHSLGRKARACFILTACILSGIGGILSACLALSGQIEISNLMQSSYVNPSFHGVSYGVWLIATMVSYFIAIENNWRQMEMLLVLALCGNAVGLMLYAPPLNIGVFLILFLIMVVLSGKLAKRSLVHSASLRCAMTVLITLVVPILFAYTANEVAVLANLVESIEQLKIFPEKFFESRDVLSGIAIKTWENSPWIGSGSGSFPIDIRLYASADLWKHIAPLQSAVPCWWLNMMAERGVIGLLISALYVGFVFYTWVLRAINMRELSVWQPIHLLLPVLLISAVPFMFFDVSICRPEVVLAYISIGAVSASAMPVYKPVDKTELGD